jgi:release factor glutamine methyltransferase
VNQTDKSFLVLFFKKERLPLLDALRAGTAALASAGIESPALDARLLLAHVVGSLLDRKRIVPTDAYAALLARRAAHEPVALILGRREFWSLDFEISPATLIPRPDSETLIEAALAARPDRASVRRVLDLGTGTGCLLLAALGEFPAAWGLGVDRAAAAAHLAARNAARLGLAGRSAFLCGDWAASIAGRFDLVLGNPPYIPTADIAGLMPEVADHEPRLALDGGADGLDCLRSILAELPRLLSDQGLAVLEIGIGQDQAALALARAAGFLSPSLRADLGGIPRALVVPAR